MNKECYSQLVKALYRANLQNMNDLNHQLHRWRVTQAFLWCLNSIMIICKYLYLIVLRRIGRSPVASPCDILLLSKTKADIQRSDKLWLLLEKRGFTLQQQIVRNIDIFSTLWTYRGAADAHIPGTIFLYALYAQYLSARYQPKVVCSFSSLGVTMSFLKQQLFSRGGGKTVFLHHAVYAPYISHFFIDYDYYFAFGESSVVNMQSWPQKLGSTKVIKAGSPFIRNTFHLQPNYERKNILFFSGWLNGKHPEYTRAFELSIEWAEKFPEYSLYIKLHPVEQGDFVKKTCHHLPNVVVLEKSISMKQALENVSLVLTDWSNACIEAAVLNRPTVIVNFFDFDPNSDDMRKSDKLFYLERYFPPRAKTADEIRQRVEEVFANYEYYLQNCQEFAAFHLEHTTDSQEYCARVIESIYHGREDFPFTRIEGEGF